MEISHDTEPGPLREMVFALDAVTQELFVSQSLDDSKHRVGYYAKGEMVGKARTLAQCIAWTTGLSLEEVKEQNLLRWRRRWMP